MFKLVALITVLVAGQPVGTPRSLTADTSFKDIASCREVLFSQDYLHFRTSLAVAVARMQSVEEDAVSVSGVAVSAACMEDDRL